MSKPEKKKSEQGSTMDTATRDGVDQQQVRPARPQPPLADAAPPVLLDAGQARAVEQALRVAFAGIVRTREQALRLALEALRPLCRPASSADPEEHPAPIEESTRSS